ncbi:translation initiation factor IF-3 [Candidatus Fermentibacterales bacterium]|nr:translation initiation factor IF-3 [Candidatus Fermentibacterales bacterium]
MQASGHTGWRFRLIRNKIRVNGDIRSPRVRLIDDEGSHVGVVEIGEAMNMASEAGLDLVEISGNVDPPVCRIMDYGKYRYQQNRKAREARKKQHSGGLKEIKFRPTTEHHDYDFKMKHAREFLSDRYKVKATVVFRGRQLVYKDQGKDLLDRLAGDLSDLAVVEKPPVLEGRLMSMILSPVREKKG